MGKGYQPQVRVQGNTMVDLPLVATYDVDGNEITSAYVKKNELSTPTITSVTLSADGWSSQKTQTKTVSGVTSISIVSVSLASNATAEQISACGESMVRCTAQGTNSLTFTSLGESVPTVALDMVVIIMEARKETSTPKTALVTLSADGWSSEKTQTKTVSGVIPTDIITVSLASNATAEQISACGESMVRCTAQGANSLTFTALGESVPTVALDMNIIIMET